MAFSKKKLTIPKQRKYFCERRVRALGFRFRAQAFRFGEMAVRFDALPEMLRESYFWLKIIPPQTML